jgi:peptidoglycan/LPS O-acetylase OafA/YrhL
MSIISYRPDIDGLRAVAVAAVVLYHAFPTVLPGGFVGVDIFFVISGFLITGIILKENAAGTFSFARFYARRVRRIFPALAVVLSSCLAAGYFLLLPDELAQLGSHVGAGALFLSNIVLLTESSYFDVGASQKILLHLWSLGIEEQFYAAWPVLLMAARWCRLPTVASIVALITGSFVANLIVTGSDPTAAFYLPITRAWELLTGALLAVTSLRLPKAVAWLGLLCFTAACALFSETTLFPGWAAALPILAAFLIIAAPESPLNKAVLSHSWMRAVGKISYPLYLWHWPLLLFPKIVLGYELEPLRQASCVALAVALATATYLLVESPVRGDNRLYAKSFALSSILACLAVMGLSQRDGWGWRPNIVPYAQQAKHLEAQVEWPYAENGNCLSRFPSPDRREGWWFCVLEEDAPPTVFLIGNSFANHLYPGIISSEAFANDNVLQFGSCDTGLGLSFSYQPSHPCFGEARQRQEEMVTRILADNPSIHTAILSPPWPRFSPSGEALDYFDPDKVDGVYRSVPERGGETSYDAYMEALERRVATVVDAGAEPILVLMTPELGYDPGTCLASRPLRPSLADCTTDAKEELAKQAVFRAGLSKIEEKFPELKVFDPLNVFVTKRSAK